MNKIKTILITGGTGFLGSNLLKKLIELNYKIILLKRSFSNIFRINEYLNNIQKFNIDEINLEEVFKENNIDLILHCATDYGRKIINPFDVIDANLLFPLKLLELSKKYNVKYFINTDTILEKGINFYSLSKKQFYDWLNFYSEFIISANIRLEHFYGPGDDKTKFVTFIINELLINKEQINLTKGVQKRDFIFIEDVVNAFIIIINNIHLFSKGITNFDIGSGNLIKIKDLVLLLKSLTNNKNTKLNFGILPYRKNEIMSSKINLKQIKKLGWKTNYNLEMSLKKTIEFEKRLIT